MKKVDQAGFSKNLNGIAVLWIAATNEASISWQKSSMMVSNTKWEKLPAVILQLRVVELLPR